MSLLALLPILRRVWPYLAAVAGLIALYAWVDHRGYARGAAAIEARDAKLAARIDTARAKLVGRLDTIAGDLATSRQRQDQSFGDIRHDAAPVILRPIYRTVAVDADGVGLLDRARSAASDDGAGEPAGAALPAPGLSAQR